MRKNKQKRPGLAHILKKSLLTTCFPTAGLSATHVCADWLLDWSLAAKWAQLLISQQTAAYPTHRRSKCDEGWAGLK